MQYSRNQDIKTTLMPDGHVVLFNSKTEWAQILNPIGALVWEFCDGLTPSPEMVKQVASLIEDDSPKLKDDINSLIKELLENGLIYPAGQDKTL